MSTKMDRVTLNENVATDKSLEEEARGTATAPLMSKVEGEHSRNHVMEEMQTLLNEFAIQPHPDAADCERISKSIPILSAREVEVWFQNRRSRLRRSTANERERLVAMVNTKQPAQAPYIVPSNNSSATFHSRASPDGGGLDVDNSGRNPSSPSFFGMFSKEISWTRADLGREQVVEEEQDAPESGPTNPVHPEEKIRANFPFETEIRSPFDPPLSAFLSDFNITSEGQARSAKDDSAFFDGHAEFGQWEKSRRSPLNIIAPSQQLESGPSLQPGSIDTNNTTCPQCSRVFENDAKLRQHSLHHRKHICSDCNAAFTNPKELMRHKNIHHTMRRELSLCPVCSRAYSRKDNLYRHLKRFHLEQEHPHAPSKTPDNADRPVSHITDSLRTTATENDRREQPDMPLSPRVAEKLPTNNQSMYPKKFTMPPTDSGYASNKQITLENDPAMLEDDGNISVISDGPSLGFQNAQKERLVSAFAAELVRDLDLTDSFAAVSITRDGTARKQLGRIFKDFAVSLQRRAILPCDFAATRFLRKLNKELVNDVIDLIQCEVARADLPDGQNMTVHEKLTLWLEKAASEDRENPTDAHYPSLQAPEMTVDECQSLLDEDNEYSEEGREDYCDVSTIPGAMNAKKFLQTGNEYQWLVWSVQAITKSAVGPSWLDLRQKFLDATSKSSIHILRNTEEALIHLNWNPEHVLYNLDRSAKGQPLGNIITYSGQEVDAWATTLQQYIQTIWPTLGISVLTMFQELLSFGKSTAEYRSSGVELTMSKEREGFAIHAKTEFMQLLEVFEIVAWIGAACRACPAGLAHCSPYFYTVESQQGELAFTIDYKTHKLPTDSKSQNTCWHQLVRNPVIVMDAPVPRRGQQIPGAEMSLEMLATLGQAFWATTYNGFLLKGFNSAMVPVKRVGSSVLWHFIVDKTGERLSYCDIGLSSAAATLADAIFPGARHFVGCSANAELVAGTDAANYSEIKYSKTAGDVVPGIEIAQSTSISGGHWVNLGITISRGLKDTPVYLATDPYERIVSTVSKWPVIFGDTKSKRFWLVDGATATLHLGRASIQSLDTSDDEAKDQNAIIDKFNNRVTNITASQAKERRLTSACQFLLDLGNRQSRLWVSESRREIDSASSEGRPEGGEKFTTKWYLFEDLVRYTYQILEKIRDREKLLSLTLTVTPSLKRTFVGFEFRDIVDECGTIDPKSHGLGSPKAIWLDLSHKLQTINILGADFGDLITFPANSLDQSGKCVIGGSVPVDQNYLTVHASSLRKILCKCSTHTREDICLVGGSWIKSVEDCFKECSCIANESPCCSVVTKFSRQPSSKIEVSADDDVLARYPNAGIIFGHGPPRSSKVNKRKRSSEATVTEKRMKPSPDSAIDVGSSGHFDSSSHVSSNTSNGCQVKQMVENEQDMQLDAKEAQAHTWSSDSAIDAGEDMDQVKERQVVEVEQRTTPGDPGETQGSPVKRLLQKLPRRSKGKQPLREVLENS